MLPGVHSSSTHWISPSTPVIRPPGMSGTVTTRRGKVDVVTNAGSPTTVEKPDPTVRDGNDDVVTNAPNVTFASGTTT